MSASNDFGIRLVSKRWTHHSLSSGYDRGFENVGTPIANPAAAGIRERLVPERLAIPLVARSGLDEYTLAAFYHELAAARDMVAHRGPTLYHVLYGDDGYRYLGLARRVMPRHRLVATYHLPPVKMERLVHAHAHLRYLDALIVVASSQVEYFARYIDRDRIHCIRHGIDVDAFTPGPSRADDAARRCLFVGLHERDFEVLEELAGILAVTDPPTRLVVVSDAAERSRFAARANVEFRSGVGEDELLSLYRDCDVFVQPLRAATANNSILEALACGCPIVASDLPGITDYIDADCAVLVPPGDANAMGTATLALLDDPARRRALSAAARTRAETLAWPTIIAAQRAVYADLFRRQS